MEYSQIEVIDLFAGAGGVTEGIEQAQFNGQKIARVLAALNHDPIALGSHAENHKGVKHFVEDIRGFDVTRLPKFSPGAIGILWASLECTNHSNAKGGLPRDADSRSLANDLFPYINFLKPDYIIIENVREFMAWGPVDKRGKPISRKKGLDYLAWRNNVCSYGYSYKRKLINAADLGAYTSRIRYFGIFAKDGLPIAFPMPTHSKQKKNMIADCAPWKPVKDVLDLEDEGESIFTRETPLVERTLNRILSGLRRYVKPGVSNFLHSYYGSGKNYRSISEPAGTITTKDRMGLVKVHWLDKRYNGSHNHQPINTPAGSITTNPKLAQMTASFIMATNFSNEPTALTEPIGTITANRKWHYLVNPQYSNPPTSVEKPCFTLIARMDKKPPILITTEAGELAIEVLPEDSDTMREIKKFMAGNGIVDIKMRMLNIAELKRITGLPEDYVLLGAKGLQKKFIGNAVPPVMSQRIVETLFREYHGAENKYDELPLFEQATG